MDVMRIAMMLATLERLLTTGPRCLYKYPIQQKKQLSKTCLLQKLSSSSVDALG